MEMTDKFNFALKQMKEHAQQNWFVFYAKIYTRKQEENDLAIEEHFTELQPADVVYLTWLESWEDISFDL